MKKWLIVKGVPVIFIIGIVLVLGCDVASNVNEPEYIKELVCYKEGPDGLVIYFILSDAYGAMTTADGDATLSIIYEGNELGLGKAELYSNSFHVAKKDFHTAKLGVGAFEHKALIYTMGRIQYDSFKYGMSGSTGKLGKIILTFQRSDGKIIKNEKDVFF